MVHCISRGSFHAYGLKLESLTSEQRLQVNSLVKALKLLNFRERQDRLSLVEDFQKWITELTQGKGWVPSVPATPTPQTTATVTSIKDAKSKNSDSDSKAA